MVLHPSPVFRKCLESVLARRLGRVAKGVRPELGGFAENLDILVDEWIDHRALCHEEVLALVVALLELADGD